MLIFRQTQVDTDGYGLMRPGHHPQLTVFAHLMKNSDPSHHHRWQRVHLNVKTRNGVKRRQETDDECPDSADMKRMPRSIFRSP